MFSKWKSRYLEYSFLLLVKMAIVLGNVNQAAAIDCFKCVSINGDNPHCEDPFHNNYSASMLHTPCWAGRKNRDGVFPATACIKLNGVFSSTGKTMMVRDCALDSGTLTTDTELVRMSHCGSFVFDEKYVSGCVQSCFEDACNASFQVKHTLPLLLLTLIMLLVVT